MGNANHNRPNLLFRKDNPRRREKIGTVRFEQV
jgi:hypothetical protein